jgi:Ca2+-transporting ATPase
LDGVAMLFLNFVIAVIPSDHHQPGPARSEGGAAAPHNPRARIFNAVSGPRWIALGLLPGTLAIAALQLAPGGLSIDGPSTGITLGFIVMGLGTAFAGFTMHRTPGWSFEAPVLRPLALTGLAVFIMFLTTRSASCRAGWIPCR